jgi:hypothetical protein
MATVYAVFKEGVYRHECGGIFSTQEAAINAAKFLIAGESDDWHTYSVVPFELDLAPRRTPEDWQVVIGHTKPINVGCEVEEAEPVLILGRTRGIIEEREHT